MSTDTNQVQNQDPNQVSKEEFNFVYQNPKMVMLDYPSYMYKNQRPNTNFTNKVEITQAIKDIYDAGILSENNTINLYNLIRKDISFMTRNISTFFSKNLSSFKATTNQPELKKYNKYFYEWLLEYSDIYKFLDDFSNIDSKNFNQEVKKYFKIAIDNLLFSESIFGVNCKNKNLSDVKFITNNLHQIFDYIELWVFNILQLETNKFNSLFNLPPVITFEGVDATGKGTLSRLLVETVEQITSVSHKVPYSVKRINIPDYSTFYGKNIKNRLENSKDITSDIEIDNTIYTFALNRREVLNKIQSSGSVGINNKKEIIVFDRQTTSSIAFTCGKYLTTVEEIEQPREFNIFQDSYIIYNFEEVLHNTKPITTLFKILDYMQKIYYTEFEVLKNVIPDLEVFCTSPIDKISDRIKHRRATSQKENQDNDVHKKDVHEDNFDIIDKSNKVYKLIYNLIKKFNDIKKDCFSKGIVDVKPVLWFLIITEMEKLIIHYIPVEHKISDVNDMNSLLKEYSDKILDYQYLFYKLCDSNKNEIIYNNFEEDSENKLSNLAVNDKYILKLLVDYKKSKENK